MGPRLALSLLFASALLGCAHHPRPKELTPQYEHSYAQPLDAALDRALGLMEERGYTVMSDVDTKQLVTAWWEPAEGDPRPAHRYLVMGIRVNNWRSVVRFYRQERTAKGHTEGTRDLELERQLSVRLEFLPGAEVALGHLVAPVPPSPQVGRELDFYLERWKHTDAALDELCPRHVKGVGELLRPGQTVLVGEQLGSKQVPAVVGDLVCEALEAGIPLAVGLFIPRDEQKRLDEYLASPGAPADQDTLLRGPFWQRPYQDGLSSRAVMDLIDRMRALRAAGHLFSVVAYDGKYSQANEREALMAGVWLKRRAAHPEELFLILAGNTHTRTVKGAQWDADFVPMGWHLLRADATLKSLDLSYAPGRTWGCNLGDKNSLTCGIVLARPGKRVAERPGLNPYVRLNPQPTEEGYHGLLYVGKLSPSLPATEVDRRAEEEVFIDSPTLPFYGPPITFTPL